MLALTLWPEWAACVIHLGKDWENRGPASRWWRAHAGERIALHAGKHVGGRGGWVAFEEADAAIRSTAEEAGHPEIRLVFKSSEPGARFLAKYDPVAHVLDWVKPIHLGAMVATAILGAPERTSGRPWQQPFTDGWCWPLREVRALSEPVPCRGAQGLWELSTDVERLVRAREGA